ncbi:flagellar type III secretion system pore protein FliP [Vibrio crassostreae]|uniref:flagellar type III secretion system pore protein FliP n=1 Tax=Vibrio crassostreae TaxID=246167 RepID=UPI001B316A2F|nr:flagellar type III secretion system pore protein FliP [Vibrio crassostreae]
MSSKLNGMKLAIIASTPSIANASSIPILTGSDGTSVSASMSALILMTVMTMIPTIIFTMSPFLRISIVLSMLRQATGLSTVPTNKVLAAISLVLTLFIMNPVLDKINQDAIQPFSNNEIEITEAVERGIAPLKTFMLNQTKKEHLEKFLEMSGKEFTTKEDVNLFVVWASFVTSEIQTALKIGFFIYLPFVLVDLLTAAVLMSLGMMMVSPMIISLPIKVLIFVIIDGWMNVIDSLAKSFFMVM